MDDGEGLRSTLDAMSIVGVSEAEREAVLRTVAAVLHLGNITFVDASDEGSALRDRSAKAALAAVADLLQVASVTLSVVSRHHHCTSDTLAPTTTDHTEVLAHREV